MTSQHIPEKSTIYTLALKWLEREGYELIDQGWYSKAPETDDSLEFQVVGHEFTGSAYIRAWEPDEDWTDLPEIECQSMEQFAAVVRNFEFLARQEATAA